MLARALTAAALALAAFAPPSASPDGGWKVSVRTERPFYQPGDTMTVAYELRNDSPLTAYGSSPVRGGNGCEYRITVLDLSGNLVWEPGTIFNGQFIGAGCVFGGLNYTLATGGRLGRRTGVPLIYQNGDGNGVLGAPLAPGYYIVRVDVVFQGPKQTASNLPGPGHAVELPIQVVP